MEVNPSDLEADKHICLPFLILFIPCILFELIFLILDNNKCIFDMYKYRLISLIRVKILTQISFN